MPTMDLYVDEFFISPYAFSVFVALREKGLPFGLKTVGLHKGEQLANDFIAHSLTGRVPVLEHDGMWLAESSAIIEYVDEQFADRPRMLPSEPKARARARQVMAWIRSDLLALRIERPTHAIFYTPTVVPLSKAGEAAAAKLLSVADALIPASAGALFGAFGAADADLAMMLERLIANAHDVPARLQRYAEAVWTRPSVQEWVTHERPDYVAY